MPISLSGPITLAFLVILGIFVYPSLLAPRLRAARASGLAAALLVVVIATALLAALYFRFDAATEPTLLRGAMALLWAVAPLIAASVVLWAGRDKN